MSYTGFFCYENYISVAKDVLTEQQYQEYVVAVVEMGLWRKAKVSDPLVKAMLNQIPPLMEKTDRRYESYKRYGKFGGRPYAFTREQLIETISKNGKMTQKQLAEHFGCSVRTVARHISSKEIERIAERR